MFNQFVDIGQKMRDIKRSVNFNKINSMEYNNSIENIDSIQKDFYSEELKWRNNELLEYRRLIEEHKNIGKRIPLCLNYNKIQQKILKLVARIINKLSYVITKDQNITNHHLLLSTDRLRECIQLLHQQNKELLSKSKIIDKQESQIADLYLLVEKMRVQLDELQSYNITSQITDIENEQQKLRGLIDNTKVKLREKIEANNNISHQLIRANEYNLERSIKENQNKLEKLINESEEERNKKIEILQSGIEKDTNKIGEHLTQLEQRIKKEFNRIEEDIFIGKNKLDDLCQQQQKAICRQQQLLNKYMHLDEIVPQPKEKVLAVANNVMYKAFEDKHRGTEEDIRERLKIYINYLNKSEHIYYRCIDLGCGRGEWLQLLQEQGYEAVGIDTNSEAIKVCVSKGLQAECIDLLTYLSSLEENSVDLITGFHIIEHLDYEELNQVILQCNRVLKENGIIIFETPNPLNLVVGACNFYTDVTHIRPVHPERIKFQLEYAGFYDLEYIYWQKSHIEYHEALVKEVEMSELPERIKALLIQDSKYMNCPADYGIVGRKA